jgi:hypothetical protein
MIIEESNAVKRFNKRTAAAAAAVAVAGGAAAFTLGGPLAAESQATTTQSLKLSYSCAFSWWGGPRLTMDLSGRVPTSVVPGQSFSVSGLSGTATLPAFVVNELRKSSASLTGVVTDFAFRASGASPAALEVAPLTFGPVHLSAGQSATFPVLSSPEAAGPFTAGGGKSVTITPGNVSIRLPVGTMQCTDTTPAGAVDSSWTVPVSHSTHPHTPLPLSTFGGIGAAVVLGGFLLFRLRQKSSPSSVHPGGDS